jgi:hypothetical protein
MQCLLLTLQGSWIRLLYSTCSVRTSHPSVHDFIGISEVENRKSDILRYSNIALLNLIPNTNSTLTLI